jgi:hypothetical protein
MKPRLKIAFADYATHSFRPENNFITRSLAARYELQFSDNPHILFYACSGRTHRRFRCLRVFFTGENLRPDWRTCDYAITYDRTDNADHFRLPNFARGAYGDLRKLVKGEVDVAAVMAAKTEFCNFVCSNPRCQERIRFFDKLSRYKRVDSPGKVRNNMQDAIAPRRGPTKWYRGKLEFIRRYKFTIAFENGSHPGYTTEKLPQPMWADSLPIYWGDPLVHLDFNPRSFLNFFDYGSQEALIDRIVEVDRDEALYAQYLRQPWYHDNRLPEAFEPARLDEFLLRVVETPRQPVAQVSKLTRLMPLWTWPWDASSAKRAA